MCFSQDGTLFVSGHRHALVPNQDSMPSHIKQRGALVAEITIDGEEVVQEFFDVTPGNLREQRGQYDLDRLGDITQLPNGSLASVSYRYYGVQPSAEIDDPTYGVMGETGLSHIGTKYWRPFNQKFTSRYLFEHEGEIFCGRGCGAGNASSPKGPALFKFPIGFPLDAEKVIVPESTPEWWSPCDEWTGACMIHGEPWFVARKDMLASEPWYGYRDADDGRIDPWHRDKGYHCEERAVQLFNYDHGWATLDQFHPASLVRGMTTDGSTLYIWEHGPVGNEGGFYSGENPKIHMYDVGEPPVLEPERKDLPEELTINGELYRKV